MSVALIDLQTIIFRRSLGSNFLQRVLAYYVLYFCLAEGGEVTHYEVLASIAKDVKNKKFGTKVRSILTEEKRHLNLCTKMAKDNAASE